MMSIIFYSKLGYLFIQSFIQLNLQFFNSSFRVSLQPANAFNTCVALCLFFSATVGAAHDFTTAPNHIASVHQALSSLNLLFFIILVLDMPRSSSGNKS